MRRRTIFTIVAAALVALTGIFGLRASTDPALADVTGPELTVYNQGIALVRDTRTLNLKAGVQTVTVNDIAAQVDPTSVYFKSLTDPTGTTVLEQNFEYDTASTDKLLSKYVGQTIQVITADGTMYEGTLLSGASDIILQSKSDEVSVISRDKVRDFTFPALPDGLVTQPSLVWMLDARQAGEQQAEITYLTSGIGWQADYALQLAPDSRTLGLDGRVTLDNHSGATYTNATLKLVAGNVNIVQSPQPLPEAPAVARAGAIAPSVAQRSFSEYHLYQIGHPVTVKDNQTKQIQFITAAGVPADKYYVYDGSSGLRFVQGSAPQVDPNYGANTGVTQVQTFLQFSTGKEGVNAALPQGVARVYQQDADGNYLLIGEDTVQDTPQNENVTLNLGNAFDIVGERQQTDFKQVSDKVIDESFQITLRNQKTNAVQVRVDEHLYRASDWQITAESAPHTRLDAQTAEWRLDVPAGGQTTLTYTVRYQW